MFTCPLCHTEYQTKRGIDNHTCKEQQRIDKLQSTIGMTSYRLFIMWRELKYKKKCSVDKEQFSHSKYFKIFYDIVVKLKYLEIDNHKEFIQYMVAISMEPVMWTDTRIYNLYYNHIDSLSPEEQCNRGIETLLELAEYVNCDASEIFDKLSTGDIIHLIKKRKLSPWVLFGSDKFKNKYAEYNPEIRKNFNKNIKLQFWIESFKNNPAGAILVQQALKKANL